MYFISTHFYNVFVCVCFYLYINYFIVFLFTVKNCLLFLKFFTPFSIQYQTNWNFGFFFGRERKQLFSTSFYTNFIFLAHSLSTLCTSQYTKKKYDPALLPTLASINLCKWRQTKSIQLSTEWNEKKERFGALDSSALVENRAKNDSAGVIFGV